MAVSTESAGRVRQRSKIAVFGGGTTTLPISPYHWYALKAFFLHMAANKGNPDLQFLPYDNTTSGSIKDGGTDLVGAACTLYAWFGATQRTSGTTAAFEALHDASTNGATTTTVWTAKTNASGQSFLVVEPNGRALATGCTISSATAVGGATESATGDASTGFVIIGAA